MKLLSHIASEARGSVGGAVYQSPRHIGIRVGASMTLAPSASNLTIRMRTGWGSFGRLWQRQTPTVRSDWQKWALAYADALRIKRHSDSGRTAALMAFMFHRYRSLLGAVSPVTILLPPPLERGPLPLSWLPLSTVRHSTDISIAYRNDQPFTVYLLLRVSKPQVSYSRSPRIVWDTARQITTTCPANTNSNRSFTSLTPNTCYWFDLQAGLDSNIFMSGLRQPIRLVTLP